jgi:hypothetical protein
LIAPVTEEVWNRRNLEMLEELVVDDYLIRNLGDGAVAVRGVPSSATTLRNGRRRSPICELTRSTASMAANA